MGFDLFAEVFLGLGCHGVGGEMALVICLKWWQVVVEEEWFETSSHLSCLLCESCH